MQIEFLKSGETLFVVKRKFKPTSWFVEGLLSNKFSVEEACEFYHSEKILRGPDDTHYLVNEVPDAEIVNE